MSQCIGFAIVPVINIGGTSNKTDDDTIKNNDKNDKLFKVFQRKTRV